MPLSFTLSDAERTYLACLVRLSVGNVFDGVEEATPPPMLSMESDETLSGVMDRHLGSFVTITLRKQLRGCIGTIVSHEPLYENVWNMARAAAFNDPRFPPLKKKEWQECESHVSVLDELTPCPDPEAVEVGRHGLVLQYQGKSGVFLPQVPVEQGWDRHTYLEQLCGKAGLPPGSWRAHGAKLFWYEALVFPC
jgi:AmmeMemoRadiSam system protein A